MEDHEIRKAGLKVTVPRVKILKIFEDAGKRHLSAEDVFTALQGQQENVGLATVYRVLTQFEVAGLLIRHNFESDHAVFELDTGEHHDHMVCTECGRVQEFVDEDIEQRQHAMAERLGFKMTDHNLTIYGICGNCIR